MACDQSRQRALDFGRRFQRPLLKQCHTHLGQVTLWDLILSIKQTSQLGVRLY